MAAPARPAPKKAAAADDDEDAPKRAAGNDDDGMMDDDEAAPARRRADDEDGDMDGVNDDKKKANDEDGDMDEDGETPKPKPAAKAAAAKPASTFKSPAAAVARKPLATVNGMPVAHHHAPAARARLLSLRGWMEGVIRSIRRRAQAVHEPGRQARHGPRQHLGTGRSVVAARARSRAPLS